ncbi:ABC transporter ATP-binding protein, partial [uncultured Dubosiella sp.]
LTIRGSFSRLHFMILPGQIWRITGASGTGKSTLFSLLVRRNEEKEYEGEITYNEEDIRFIDRQEYYRKVLCVEQEPALFQGTIMDNITFGKNYPAQKIEEIIKICGLEDLIEKKGRDAPIENNGKNLSGGQKQRIALARMLIKEPDVLLIDEGLSGIHKDLRNNIVDRLVLYARQNNMAILTISHDHEFDHAADRVLKIGGKNEKSGS